MRKRIGLRTDMSLIWDNFEKEYQYVVKLLANLKSANCFVINHMNVVNCWIKSRK